jgi:hypothetical protein
MTRFGHDTVLNYTPHRVNLILPSGSIPFESVGVARCAEVTSPLNPMTLAPLFSHWDLPATQYESQQVTLVSKRFGLVTGLPDATDFRRYIVSQIVADALPDRDDLLVPHDIIRDAAGQVVGCRGFSTRAP